MGGSPRRRTAFASATMSVIVLMVFSGIVAASPDGKVEWKDKARDVTLANADMLSGSATEFDGLVDLRVSFAARPFPETATHQVTWCVDLDVDAQTGGICGWGALTGADWAISLYSASDGGIVADLVSGGAVAPVDVHPYLWYDAGNTTLRLLIPASWMGGVAAFHYIVVSAFGGSSGVNDQAPRRPDFARAQGYFASGEGELPFSGGLWYP